MANQYNISEEQFLREYDPSVFEKPSTTVDTVIFTIIEDSLHVLTIQRSEHPFKGFWSLVGGYIDIQKDINIEATAKRKLEEKTGIKTPYLEQFETIGSQLRDPRGWSITMVYFALLPSVSIKLQKGKGSDDIKWSKVENGTVENELAFDHADILKRCTERLRSKVLYTSLPAYLMPKQFTLGELQKVYEIILDKKIDPKSFRRRIINANILDETDFKRMSSSKPAKLYSLKDDGHTFFFIRNIEGAS